MTEISYIIATSKPLIAINTTIDSIESVPEHTYEIIVCGPTYVDRKNTTFIPDDKMCGATYAFNKAVEKASGKFTVLLTDDVVVPRNFLDYRKWAESELYHSLKIHVGNVSPYICGGGMTTYHKSQQQFTSHWDINSIVQDDTDKTPYDINFNPIILTEDIKQYLDGYIFSPVFEQNYADHWLGLYCQTINQVSVNWPLDVFVEPKPEFDRISKHLSDEEEGRQKFLKLRRMLKNSHISYSQSC